MKFRERVSDLSARVRVWWREHLERAAERKAMAADPPGVKVPAWLVRAAHFSKWAASFVAAYFLWSYCIGIAGDQASALHVTHVLWWRGDVEIFFPAVAGFALLAIGIPILAQNIIPIYVSFDWRASFWPKAVSGFLVLATSLAIIAGSFSLMGSVILEHGRGAAVATEQVQQGRAAIQAQIDQETSDLRDMMNNRNAYMAQAANVGADAWRTGYIEQARRTHDDRLPMIERALGAAEAADARRAHITQLRAQLASAQTVASVAATPAVEGSGWMVQAMGIVRSAWALILSVLNDIVCLVMGWLALRLEQTRNQQLSQAGGIPQHSYMVEDKTKEGDVLRQRQQRTAQDAAYEVLSSGGTREDAAEAARAATRMAKNKTKVEGDDGADYTEYYERRGGMVRKPNRKKRADGKEEAELHIHGEMEVTTQAGTFTTGGVRAEERSGSGGWGTHGPSAAIAIADEKNNSRNEPAENESGLQIEEPRGQDEPPIPELTSAEEWAAIDDALAAESTDASADAPVDQPDADEHGDDGAAPDQHGERDGKPDQDDQTADNTERAGSGFGDGSDQDEPPVRRALLAAE